MAYSVSSLSSDLRPVNDKINAIEQEIAELNWQITGAEKEILALLYQLEFTKELIDRFQAWIDLDGRQTLDVNKIRTDLQAELDANEKLPAADSTKDDFESYKRSKQLSDCQEREQFIQRTAERAFRNEAKLRCVRAARKIIE